MLYGAIIGDIVGSKYEFNNIKTVDFPLFDKEMFFTDDTVMTVAVYEAVKKTSSNGFSELEEEVIKKMKEYGLKYEDRGYGDNFKKWLKMSNPVPYNSYGNGSAMRVSSVAYFAKSLEEVKSLSYRVSAVSHNHPDGIKGAEATSVAIYKAIEGKSKEEIREYINNNYYKLDFTLDEIRDTYKFNVSCKDSVPQAIEAFLESDSFVDCIRKSISIGGDSDTIASIAGAIAEAYYGIEESIKKEALTYLDEKIRKIVLEANK